MYYQHYDSRMMASSNSSSSGVIMLMCSFCKGHTQFPTYDARDEAYEGLDRRFYFCTAVCRVMSKNPAISGLPLMVTPTMPPPTLYALECGVCRTLMMFHSEARRAHAQRQDPWCSDECEDTAMMGDFVTNF